MLKICILIGSANISGGTNVILNHAIFLKNAGHSVHIVPIIESNNAHIRWHIGIDLLNFITLDEAKQNNYDLCIATYFHTVYLLPEIKAGQYMYFIQSIESLFNFNIKEITAAQFTYSLGLPYIAIANWINKYLKNQYNCDGYTVLNGIEKKIFNTKGSIIEEIANQKELTVLVEGQLNRFSKNVNDTIALLRKTKAKKNIYLATISKVSSYSGCKKVFSNVTQEQMATIYRSCDVLVKISYVEGMFGPPLEMFHCGNTAIVNRVTGYEEYIYEDINACVINKEKEVIAKVNYLYENKDQLQKLKENAIRTAQAWVSVEESGANFLTSVINILNSTKYDVSAIKVAKRLLNTTMQLHDIHKYLLFK